MELASRKDVEAEFQRNQERLMARHKRELAEYLGRPPDPSRVPLSFWERVEREERELLAVFLLLVALRNSEQHGMVSAMEQQQIEGWARRRAFNTAQAYSRNTQAKVLTLGRDANEQGGMTTTDLRNRLTDIFGADRAESTVTTETTAASAYGGEVAVVTGGKVSELDVWRNQPTKSRTGPCKICRPLHGMPRRDWQLLFPAGPPAHPRCVCDIGYEAFGEHLNLLSDADLERLSGPVAP